MRNLIRLCGLAAVIFALSGKVQAQELEPAPLEPAPLETAPAAEPAHPWSAALLLGYGFDLGEEVNPFGLAIGLRGGYSLEKNFYVGAQFIYFGGDSVEGFGGEVSFNEIIFGVEGGYDIWAQPVLIRPTLGLGLAFTSASTEFAGVEASNTETDLYIAPGATVLYPIENNKFFVGGDARLWFITASDTFTGLSIAITGGMNF